MAASAWFVYLQQAGTYEVPHDSRNARDTELSLDVCDMKLYGFCGDSQHSRNLFRRHVSGDTKRDLFLAFAQAGDTRWHGNGVR